MSLELEEPTMDWKYDVIYCDQIIKTFNDRREAIQYVDDFFGGVDDDRRSDNIYVYCGEFVKLYSGFRNLAYKE